MSRSPRPSPAPAERTGPSVAILIDDLGNDRAAVARIAAWPFAVAGAVLPDLPGSPAAARALAESGKEVLLHLPMEPHGYPAVRPGPGVILRSQSDAEIERTLEEDLESVPGASGMNNHMGSAATADARVMRAVVAVLARRGLYFVDSRTTGSTVARDAAEAAGVPSTSRRVFLDDVATPEGVERSFEQLLGRAREEGSALAIGHPHPATLSVLEQELPTLARRGVRLVKVRDLVQ
ncbi:MAG TPA: divergent polysaccharide deacetylase family protein [Thermoanaerobaculia bacterium]|nr:divergent polysaccharide deacetylase family protein [Thermoanaerobaculia bacterium]